MPNHQHESVIVTFALDDSWVWDFWLADDGQFFHLYYLHAPKTLPDQVLRHRNAAIGHATSRDLVSWTDHGPVLTSGAPGAFDATATWTGSVVRGDDGLWRMFYTGARFHGDVSPANTQSVGVAVSVDLHEWSKVPGPAVSADPRWYETLGSSEWPEEAWRDPWVFRDPSGDRWHMLITARSRRAGPLHSRGVIGHAESPDLESWEVRPPLTAAITAFGHLEVPQVCDVDGKHVLLFSCPADLLAEDRPGTRGGIWVVDDIDPAGPYDIDGAVLLADEALYSGRLIVDRKGRTVLLAVENHAPDGSFPGRITDPLPLARDQPGRPRLRL
jgi:beta-fructofuranosidase